MSLYEGMFLMDNRQANRDWDGALEKLQSSITKHGAEILRCVKWGERKLAYEIDGRRRATYVLIYFQGAGRTVLNIYRECELSDLIHRALMLKIQKLPSEEEMAVQADYARGRPSARPAARERPRAREEAPAHAQPETASATSVEEPAAAPEAAPPAQEPKEEPAVEPSRPESETKIV